jgi:glycosyltransferase involved in cell wall biosynthesis
LIISIVVPVYNESKTIFQILKKISKIKKIKKEVIIVNDGSNDNTREIINAKCKNLFNKFISYKKNRGKGYACIIGLKKVTGDIVIIQDADLEYDPKDYQKLLTPIISRKTKIVYGRLKIERHINA